MGYFAAAAMKTMDAPEPASLPAHLQSLIERLDTVNVDELSPRQAMDVLYALKSDLEAGQ
jgi:hypothetical protein